MLNVCYALVPMILAAIYLFGLRCFFLIIVVLVFGIAAEAVFTLKHGKPVTSAVFVTCLIYTLSLPPAIPIWMAIIGIVFGVVFGKMVFGGFGQNVFNPAMVGRCFIYIAFPQQMTNVWTVPLWAGYGGFSVWQNTADAVTRATPMSTLTTSVSYSLKDLFLGNISGSMGETSALLIILGGMFIIYQKSAQWRLALSCFLGGLITCAMIRGTMPQILPPLIFSMLAGSFLFGCAFVVTEPISGPKTHPGQWMYGFFVGSLTMLLRGFSNFAEGFMFSILLANAFVPIIDRTVSVFKIKRKGNNE